MIPRLSKCIFLLTSKRVASHIAGTQIDGQPIREVEQSRISLLLESVAKDEGAAAVAEGELDGVAAGVPVTVVVDTDEGVAGGEGLQCVTSGGGGIFAGRGGESEPEGGEGEPREE